MTPASRTGPEDARIREPRPVRPAMIFHVPFPLEPGAARASAIRPVRMRQAFADLGYEVHTVAGTGAQRAAGFRRIRRLMAGGLRPEFVYSEAATMPTALTEPHHLPLRPWQDARFLARMRRAGVPLGLFYRDVYWRYPVYRESVPALIAAGTRALYRLDLLVYRRTVTRLYLPSANMAEAVPIVPAARMAPLPPGCDLDDRAVTSASEQAGTGAPDGSDDLRLLYVGGLGSMYRLHEVFRAVARTPGVRLTVCTREAEWQAHAAEYVPLLSERVEIVHLAGAELEAAYRRADLSVLFVEPSGYRDFASPMKLYEALGHGVPVLATEGTLSGRFVTEHGVGWAPPYSAGALSGLLTRLRAERGELRRATERVRSVRHDHTWLARARQVEADLTAAAGTRAGPGPGGRRP